MNIQDADSELVIKHQIEQANEKIKTATALSIMRSTDGWQILLNTFENMREDQRDELLKQTPGNEKAVLAAHAVAFAVENTIRQIVDGVQLVIEEGREALQFLEEINRPPEQPDEYE